MMLHWRWGCLMLLAIVLIGDPCRVVSLAPAALVHAGGARVEMHTPILEPALWPAPLSARLYRPDGCMLMHASSANQHHQRPEACMHGAPANKSSLPGHRGLKPQQHLALPTQGSLRTESGRQRFPEKKKCPSLLLRVPHLWRHPQRPQRLLWQHPQVSENACCH